MLWDTLFGSIVIGQNARLKLQLLITEESGDVGAVLF